MNLSLSLFIQRYYDSNSMSSWIDGLNHNPGSKILLNYEKNNCKVRKGTTDEVLHLREESPMIKTAGVVKVPPAGLKSQGCLSFERSVVQLNNFMNLLMFIRNPFSKSSFPGW